MQDKVIPHTGSRRKPRVLVVENDTDIRALNVEKLVDWDYEPVVAEGRGKPLLEDARQKARAYRCHLALVDLHLLDDYDPDDWSGLMLVPDLRPARAIIYSGSADYQAGREAVGEYGALVYVGKSEGPEYLRKKLDQYARQYCACRSGTVIHWPEGLSAETVMQRMFPNQPDVPDVEIEDLLVTLFPTAKELKLDFLGSYPAVLSQSRVRSLVLQLRVDDEQPLLLKLIRAEKLEKEVKNYEDYVRNHLVGSYRPTLQTHHSLVDVGGAVYSFVGISENFQSFSQFYRDAGSRAIKITLRRFFKVAWSPWYQRTAPGSGSSLYQEYCRVWGGEWWVDRLIEHYQAGHLPAMSKVWPKSGSMGLPEPLPWLMDRVRSGTAGEFEHFPVTVTHGDLRGDNMLVDRTNQNAWVLDFERTGAGHALQDFVELEADILTYLTPLEPDEQAQFLQLCLLAAAPDRVGRVISPGPTDPRIMKALDTISCLRQLAEKLTRITDARQYLWGLLFNALFRVVVFKQTEQPEYHTERALLLVAILCHRLDHWGDNWPPGRWTGEDRFHSNTGHHAEEIIEEHHA